MLQDWLQLNLVPQRSSLCSLQHLAFWTVYIVYKPAMFRTFNIETVCCLYIVYLPATFKTLDAFSKCTVLLVSLVSLVLLVLLELLLLLELLVLLVLLVLLELLLLLELLELLASKSCIISPGEGPLRPNVVQTDPGVRSA